MAASHPFCRRAASNAARRRIPQTPAFFCGRTNFENLFISSSSSSVPRRVLSTKPPPNPSGPENAIDQKARKKKHSHPNNENSQQQTLQQQASSLPIPLPYQEKQPLTPVSRFKHSKRKEYRQNPNNNRRTQQQQRWRSNNNYDDFDSPLVRASDYVYRRHQFTETEMGETHEPSLSSSSSSNSSDDGDDALRHGITSTRRRGGTTDIEQSPSASSSTNSIGGVNNGRLRVLPSIDAAALLNPRKFCKDSAKFSHVHNIPRSIHGTEAARRLLRGKKDFIVAARKLMSPGIMTPMLLEGHGVPLPLFQHSVDLADALLLHYGPDVVQCSFRNYHNSTNSSSYAKNNVQNDMGFEESKIPPHFRVFKRNAAKASLEPKPAFSRFQCEELSDDDEKTAADWDDVDFIEWDHHLKLYLTVMERLATGLGLVLEVATPKRMESLDPGSTDLDIGNGGLGDSNLPPIDKFDYFSNDDDNDFTSSPLLFPLRPYWNVTMVRNAHFDLQLRRRIRDDDSSRDTIRNRRGWDDRTIGSKNNEEDRRNGLSDNGLPPPPLPIVEFIQDRSMTRGRIVISVQGYATRNEEFLDTRRRRSRKPVTLLFDACFRTPLPRFPLDEKMMYPQDM